MKTFRASRGPWKEQPYFSQEDVERLCLEELRRTELLPTEPAPIRIERFLEKRFRVVPQYEDLPPGVLGFTRFGPDGVEAVSVSRRLVEEGTSPAERRLNTTLAHEAGHGLLQVSRGGPPADREIRLDSRPELGYGGGLMRRADHHDELRLTRALPGPACMRQQGPGLAVGTCCFGVRHSRRVS